MLSFSNVIVAILNDDSNDQFDMDFTTSNRELQRKIQPTSPSAHLAMEMGTDSHKLQLMKASFFVEDDYDGRSGNFLYYFISLYAFSAIHCVKIIINYYFPFIYNYSNL